MSIETFTRKLFSQRVYQAVVLLGLVIYALHPAVILGQTPEPNIQYSNKASDQNLRSNLRVNPSTLAVEFDLTLNSYPGRGGLAVPITLSYSSKVWRVGYQAYKPSIQNTFDGQFLEGYTELSAAFNGGWTSSIGIPVMLFDELAIRYNNAGMPVPETTDCNAMACFRIDRVFFRMPNNAVHELRSSDEPYSVGNGSALPIPAPDNLYAVDGSGLRYQRSTQTLFQPDGSRYILSTTAPRFIDRNGNTLTFTADFPFNIQNNIDVAMTDTLGRSMPAFRKFVPNNTDVVYRLPGINDTDMNYTFRWKKLDEPGVLAAGQQLHYIADLGCPPGAGQPPPAGGNPSLFSSDSASRIFICDTSLFNPLLLHQIVLPNQQTYTFTYNAYGELEKVVLPGGGYERFEYGPLMPISMPGPLYSQANRGVTKRFLSHNGNLGDEIMWTYAFTGTFPYGSGTTGVYILTETAPDLSRIDRYIHTDSLLGGFGFNVDQGKAGMIYDERQFSAPDGSGNSTLLRRKLTEWVTTGTNSTNSVAQQSAKRNARVAKEVSILFDTDTTSALAKTTVYNYDLTYQYTIGAIASSVVEYDWSVVSKTTAKTASIGSFSAPTPALRTSETTNLLLDSTIPQTIRDAYRDRHLVGLVSSTRVKDSAGTIVAKNSMKYDEYTLATVGNVSGWADPQSAYRGNMTTSGRWLNTTNNYLESHNTYDQFGNVRTKTDSNGNQTQIAYDPEHTYPTTVTTAVPDPSGQHGSTIALTSNTTYDVPTGLVTSTTDANQKTTSMMYGLSHNRLVRVTHPDGSQINYVYSDVPGDIYVKTLTDLDASRAIETRTYYDGIGRPVRNFIYDGTPSTPWTVSDTYYDTRGRVSKVSNPYRVASASAIVPSTCSDCTTTAYDVLGRTTSVTTPDNAQSTTSYSANTSGVLGPTAVSTDPAGKARKTVNDALGRLVVVESPGGPTYQTTYTYDVLDNLTRVVQDTQERNFVYDSLSRLKEAMTPESGTILYQYDNNDNLIQRTDARSVISTYTYDALNRNKTVDYSNTTISPDVSRVYDGAVNGKGRLWRTYAGGTETTGVDVEKTLLESYDALGRPLVLKQFFKVNSVWSSPDFPYKVSRTYNLAGGVSTQTYPSERFVTYNYDAAGRLADKDGQNPAFTGNLGGASRTYSRGISYDPSGALKQEQFGTNTAVYHKRHYNVRKQLCDVRASNVNDEWGGELGAIVNYYSTPAVHCGSGTNNNGNLLMSQTIINSVYFEHRYTYDDLNRLTSVNEHLNGNSTAAGTQQYDYDQWGNRTIVPSSLPLAADKIFEKQNATNRLYAPGDLALPEAQRRVQYDQAGNQTKDTYTGHGMANYDAENRIASIQDNLGGWSNYTYNADGQRTRRKVNNQETWQIFGMDGELVAEYPANGALASPQKEYGYRNGQLLVVATPSQGGDHSLSLNGSTGYVQVPNSSSLNISGAITVEAWVKVNSIGAYQDIISRESYGQSGTGGGYALTVTNVGKPRIDLYHSPTTYTPVIGNTTMSTGQWYHIAGVWDGAYLKVYLNGNLDGTVNTGNGPGSGTSSVKIGRNSGGAHFNGLVDEVRVSNAAVYTGNFTPSMHLNASGSTKGLWKLDGQTITDSSGNGNNGSLQAGATYSTDVPTGPAYHSLSANGSDAYVQVANSSSLNITGAITVEAWIKPNSIGTYQYIASRESYAQSGTGGGYELTLNNAGKARFDVYHSPTTYTPVVGNTVLSTGVWHHIAGVWDGSYLKLYVNGNLDSTVNTGNGPASGTSSLKIGRNSGGGYFNGLIDEVRVSNTVVYTSNFTPQTHLTASSSTKGLWKFDGQTITDSSGNSNNGTLQGGATYSNDVPSGDGGGGSSGGSGSQVQWMVADHLGTPRMIIDQTGTLANVKRHDYLPFGEELVGGARTTTLGYGGGDGVRQQFTEKERDIETSLDYFGARYFSSTQGRFTSVDPLDPVLGKQGAGNHERAEREFRTYLAQPQNWNRYTYCVNNPLRHVDPDGFETLTVNLNIVFDDAAGYTDQEKQIFKDNYVAQLQKDFAHADIQFNVTYTQGRATNTANRNREITSGTVDGAINTFVTRGSVGPAPEVTRQDKGVIFISTGSNMRDESPGNLTHGVIHALGIAGGVNGYTSPANTSDNRYYLILSEIGNSLTGNSAESATQSVQNHFRVLSSGGYTMQQAMRAHVGYGPPTPTLQKEINYLREGARRYLKK